LLWAEPLFESVGKILPGRFNIILTTKRYWKKPGVIKVASIKEAIEAAQNTGCKELFIAGGGVVYNECMSLADKIYMTRVHTQLDGDSFSLKSLLISGN
jgi:dihydrofolate reductase